jgi:hypothetical protein
MESNLLVLPQGAPTLLARGEQTLGKETSEYQEEEKSIEIPLLAASENGSAQTESYCVSSERCGVRLSICNPELQRPNSSGKTENRR